MMLRICTFLLLLFPVCSIGQIPFRHDLQSRQLPTRWDEGLPLGNGMIGALIWQKDGKLRLSLDRADLWDLRPTADLDCLDFALIRKQVESNAYEIIQRLGDVPYERDPAPTKIPGAALEFDIASMGEVVSSRLLIKNGLAQISWKNGATFNSFIHPTLPVGWFRFDHKDIQVKLVPPRYRDATNTGEGNSVQGQGLARLGYQQGSLVVKPNKITYTQPGWNGFSYQVSVQWQLIDGALEGAWSITSNYAKDSKSTSIDEVAHALQRGYKMDLQETIRWWKNYWSASSLTIPDSVLEEQWYLEQYKFGCVARANTPPITLQAIWTADNGNLPPWKGDIHNDLNVQLSYWPSYSSNHLAEEEGLVNWLHAHRPAFEAWTRKFYGKDGLNVPGVCTLDGAAMGGWVQYSMSPTVAGWLGHHFYLHWRYTKDTAFLREKAYPWIRDFATFIQNFSVTRADGQRQLPLSSSPEFYDNTSQAWFRETTNYDLAIIRWSYQKAAELAHELGNEEDVSRWQDQLQQWPTLSIDKSGSLLLAPGIPYPESHRHFSHMLGIHPLGILDYRTPDGKRVVDASMKLLEEKGTSQWVGYSFSWQANLYARMGKGEQAAEALRKFATCFCLANSFHVNGDQCGGKNSSYTYRPFTLEGNFAFAAGLQEMLIQSHDGIIRVFPALPDSWKEVSFTDLRTEGAFLVSATLGKGQLVQIKIISEKGGELKIDRGSREFKVMGSRSSRVDNNILRIQTQPGQQILLKPNP